MHLSDFRPVHGLRQQCLIHVFPVVAFLSPPSIHKSSGETTTNTMLEKNVRRMTCSTARPASATCILHACLLPHTFTNTYHYSKGLEKQSLVSQCTSLHYEEDTGVGMYASQFSFLNGVAPFQDLAFTAI